MIIDWQYAMSELSRKNGVDVEEEIRKAREKLNDEMAQREKKLAEEQKLLEEKMVQETNPLRFWSDGRMDAVGALGTLKKKRKVAFK